MSVDKAEVMRILAAFSPEERRALLQSAPTAAPSYKWAHIVDAIPPGDVSKVVKACRAGLYQPGIGDPLAEAHPVLAATARASSNFRGKPYEHSLQGILNYLQSEVYHDRRAAAARRLPADEEPASAPAPGKVAKS